MGDAEIRVTLEQERDELREGMAELSAVPRDPMAAVSFGKRVGDGTTEAVERLNKIGVYEKLETKLGEVERALDKLTVGSWGYCDRCGGEIPRERLEAMPWTPYCVDCAAIVRG